MLDVLVHNAAVGALKPYDKMRSAHWDLTLESSLKPFWHLTKLAPLSDGACVIGVSSLGSRRFIPGYAAMGAAKAGMEGFSRSLAREVASRGITVNSVAPGFIATDMTQALPQAQHDALLENIPLARLGAPEEIAAAVGFLTSDGAGYITGETLQVNGGMNMR